MKKINKILIGVIIIFLLITISAQVFAKTGIDPDDYNVSDPTLTETKEAVKKAGIIIGMVRNVGAVVAVITIMVVGLKYMFSSIEDKADYKKAMMPYVIGCLILISGSALISFIYDAIHR